MTIRSTSPRATIAPFCLCVAAVCVAAGAASAIDAADGWQQVLDTIHQYGRVARTCGDAVPGWGDGSVLAFAGAALALISVSAFGHTSGPTTKTWTPVSTSLAIIFVALMWLNNLAVSGAQSGDCDGMGLLGSAGNALTRAGWMYAAACVALLVSMPAQRRSDA